MLLHLYYILCILIGGCFNLRVAEGFSESLLECSIRGALEVKENNKNHTALNHTNVT